MPLLRRPARYATALATVAALAAAAACSSSDTTNPNDTTPASVSAAGGDAQTVPISTALPSPLVVHVKNAAGDALSGVTVAWTVEAGGGSLGSASTTTNAQGDASNTYTVGSSAGANTIKATAQGTSLSATFTATATAPITDFVPASIDVVSGNNQSTTISQPLANPLVVIVKNAEGQGLNNIDVDWTLTSGNGLLGDAGTTTNSAGQTSTTFTAAGSPGSATIQAAVQSNAALKTTFTATATAIVNASVSVIDNAFDPSSVTVSPGGKVTWTWNGSNGHNITWVSGGFAGKATQTSGTHEVTFGTKGTYTYYCSIHGSSTGGMRGTVTVQ